jgi:hypothetical protein
MFAVIAITGSTALWKVHIAKELGGINESSWGVAKQRQAMKRQYNIHSNDCKAIEWPLTSTVVV